MTYETDIIEDVENLVFYKSGEEAVEAVKKLFPYADVSNKTVPDLDVPDGVVICCESGRGEVAPVKRTIVHRISTRKGEVQICKMHEIWTSGHSQLENLLSIFFWDEISDQEVKTLGIPHADF